MAWLRLYDTLASDHKVMQLDCTHFKTWVLCLCNAKKNGGTLSPIPALAFELHLREDVMQKHIDALCAAGLLDKEGECYQPHNWSKFQYESDNSTERSRRHRQHKKGVACNDYATLQERPGNALRVQSTDTETESDNKQRALPLSGYPPSTPVESWVAKLRDKHPKPSDERFVATFCADNWHRLSEDEHRYEEFMGSVWLGLCAWCDYWNANGLQFATDLAKWLHGSGWKKPVPQPQIARRPETRFALPPKEAM